MEKEKERDAAMQVVTSWPAPPGWPLYASIERAAKLAGVGEATMRAWAHDRVRPLPCIEVGRSKLLVRLAALPEYMEARER